MSFRFFLFLFGPARRNSVMRMILFLSECCVFVTFSYHNVNVWNDSKWEKNQICNVTSLWLFMLLMFLLFDVQNRPINKWFISFIYASCLKWFRIFSVSLLIQSLPNLSLSSLRRSFALHFFRAFYCGVICIVNASGHKWTKTNEFSEFFFEI